MVFGSFFEISDTSRRGLARNLFSGFYDRGLSANAALRTLSELGLGYRRQDFLRDFAQGQGVYTQAIKVRFVSENKTPSESILEGRYHGVSDKYSLVFRANFVNEETGEDDSRYFFYHRNDLASRGQMEGDAQEWANNQAGAYGYGITSVRLVEGYINPIWQ